jgi:hypothetical protein
MVIMMKKLLSIIILGLLLNGNAFSQTAFKFKKYEDKVKIEYYSMDDYEGLLKDKCYNWRYSEEKLSELLKQNQIKSIGRYENGVKEGYWQHYYLGNTIGYNHGTYLKGIKNGVWKERINYCSPIGGAGVAVGEYVNGKMEGSWEFRYDAQIGTRSTWCDFVNDQKIKCEEEE